jgi:hypothetical protein
MNCRDCLHTPSGKCRKHDPANIDILSDGLQYKEQAWVSIYRERLWNPYDDLTAIVRQQQKNMTATEILMRQQEKMGYYFGEGK